MREFICLCPSLSPISITAVFMQLVLFIFLPSGQVARYKFCYVWLNRGNKMQQKYIEFFVLLDVEPEIQLFNDNLSVCKCHKKSRKSKSPVLCSIPKVDQGPLFGHPWCCLVLFGAPEKIFSSIKIRILKVQPKRDNDSSLNKWYESLVQSFL